MRVRATLTIRTLGEGLNVPLPMSTNPASSSGGDDSTGTRKPAFWNAHKGISGAQTQRTSSVQELALPWSSATKRHLFAVGCESHPTSSSGGSPSKAFDIRETNQGNFDWKSGLPPDVIDIANYPVFGSAAPLGNVAAGVVFRMHVSTNPVYSDKMHLQSQSDAQWFFVEGDDEGALSDYDYGQ